MTRNLHMIRKTCLLCDSELSDLFCFEMPVYMGINHRPEEKSISENMVFASCKKCGEVQMRNLIDLDILYQANHNNGVIGKTWEEHYIDFARFMKHDVKDRRVVEISDPSAKLPKILDGFKSWTIIEPNAEQIDIPKVNFVNEFFDRPLEKKADVIVHSHLLEHMYDPIKFLGDCSASMNLTSDMYISVPNLEYILQEKYSPNNILHFEHTYYMNDKILEFMLRKNNLFVVRAENYKNHSRFYHVKKMNMKQKDPPVVDVAQDFLKCYRKHKRSISHINRVIEAYKDIDWYIFGSHVSSQFYLKNGLDEKSFKGTLDNSSFKQGFKLYGTELETFSPEKIKDSGKVGVVCSHAGIYYPEIKKQLESLNDEAIIL